MPLISFEDLLKKSWALYKLKAKYSILLLTLTGIPLGLLMVIMIMAMNLSANSSSLAIIALVVSAMVSIFFIFWLSSALATHIYTDTEKFGSLCKQGFTNMPRFFSIYFVTQLMYSAGFILLFIPALIFMVWFDFAMAIILRKKNGVIDALKESRGLSTDRWFPVAARVFLPIILLTIAQEMMNLLISGLSAFFEKAPLLIAVTFFAGILLLLGVYVITPLMYCYKRVLLENLEETR